MGWECLEARLMTGTLLRMSESLGHCEHYWQWPLLLMFFEICLLNEKFATNCLGGEILREADFSERWELTVLCY